MFIHHMFNLSYYNVVLRFRARRFLRLVEEAGLVKAGGAGAGAGVLCL